MKKHKIFIYILAALLIVGVLSFFPAPKEARADDSLTVTYYPCAHMSFLYEGFYCSGTLGVGIWYGQSCDPVTVVPDTGYHFIQWSDGRTDNPRTDTNVTSSFSVTAEVAKNSYALDYAAGDNGTLTVGASTGLPSYEQDVNYMDSGNTVTAVPDAGNHFVQWSDGVKTASRTDANVNSSISVTAEFENGPYTLDYAAGDNGTLTVGANTGMPSYEQSVNYLGSGDEVTAVPGAGYRFVQWSDGVVNASRTDANVTENINVTAEFVQVFTLKYTAGEHGNLTAGSSTGLSTNSQTVDINGSGTAVTAVPDTGYHFVQWSDGSANATRTDTNVTAELDVTAQFDKNIYEVQYLAGDNGKLTGTATQYIPYKEAGTMVSAVPDEHYHFTQWSDGLTEADRLDKSVTGSFTVTAQFAIDTFTLKYSDDGHGSISGTASQAVDYLGSGTSVTAVPDTGYHFFKWSDNVMTQTRTDTGVAANLDVTAEFVINTYTLTYAAGGHGTLTGDTSQTVDYGGSGSAVKADPDAHYHFTKWSDGVTKETRTDKNVSKNIDVTAQFAINTYKVTFKDYDGTVLKTQNVVYGEDATPPAGPVRRGYTFTGWDGDYYDVTEAVTITAQYQKETYKVTFLSYDGKVLNTQYVDYGADAQAPAAPDREGYTFTGWDKSITNISGELNVTAQYKINTYTVTFRDYDGSVINAQSVEYGKDATVPADPERKGYTFSGWDKGFTGVKSDIDVTAQYALVVDVIGIIYQGGNTEITVQTGAGGVTGASVEGGEAKVNPDGTVTVTIPGEVKAGDITGQFVFSDGTTAQGTISITDDQIKQASAAANGIPWWIWALIAAAGASIIVIAGLLIFKRKRGTEV